MREVAFVAIGASTPVGLLAVNASAFVMRHLPEFRLSIAICALISGLSLNGLTAWTLFGRAERIAPQVFAEHRPWLVAGVVVFVVALSALGAYWTWQSMQDPRRLPNLYAVLTALWLLLLPVLMTAAGRRLNGSRPRAEVPRPDVAFREP